MKTKMIKAVVKTATSLILFRLDPPPADTYTMRCWHGDHGVDSVPVQHQLAPLRDLELAYPGCRITMSPSDLEQLYPNHRVRVRCDGGFYLLPKN